MPPASGKRGRRSDESARCLPGHSPVPCSFLVPKCPACLAAYVTLWTGLGLSFVAATWLRGTLLFLCGAILLCLVVERLHRIWAMIPYFKRETEQCHTK